MPLAVLNRPAMTSAPSQGRPHHFHSLAQFILQSEGCIDHKHAAGRQTGSAAIGVAANGQSEVDPRLLSLIAQSAQALGQIVCFSPWNDGLPNQVSARGKALQAVLYVSGHFAVIAFNFVAGVHQHHGALGA